MEDLTWFEKDQWVCKIASQLKMEVFRSESITVTDLEKLTAQGLTKESPDYKAIRKLLNQGKTVEGIELGGLQYILRGRGEAEE